MKLRLLPIALLHAIPTGAIAAGYYLPNQDAFATARGNAFVATADSAAAVFYNPAGLTQLERAQAEAGVYAIVLGTELKANGNSYEAKDELQAAPQLYYARPYNDRLSYGFGINSPFGLGTEWGRESDIAPVVTETRLTYLSGTGAAAYKVTDELSIGASFSVNYADLTLEQGLGFPGSYLRYSGDDVGVSGGISVRWQPHEQHAFGLVYSTKSTFDLSGKTTSNFLQGDSTAELDFITPARIAGGYSYRPAPGWNIEANVEWLNWDDLNELTLKSSSVGGSMGLPFHWESSFIYELGASYTTKEGYIFAAGYDLNMSCQPDENYNPGVADADRHWFNVGFGRKCASFTWMLAYQFGYSNRTVNGNVGPASLADGDYKSRINALLFSWQQEF